MGRHPLPTKVKQLQGTLRKERVPAHEPEADLRAIPMPPDTLDDYGKDIFIRTCAKLLSLQMLTSQGIPQIERYSYAYQMWKAATIAMQGGKFTSSTIDNGRMSAWMQVLREAQKTMLEFEDRWGMSPSSQNRVKWAPPEDKKPTVDDEFDI